MQINILAYHVDTHLLAFPSAIACTDEGKPLRIAPFPMQAVYIPVGCFAWRAASVHNVTVPHYCRTDQTR